MKKILYLFSGLLLLIGFSACEEESKVTDVNLHFNAYFSNEPLLMYEADYDYVENMKMRFQLFHQRLFINQIFIFKNCLSWGVFLV